jgi:antirestriction protein ArdC
MTNAMIVLLEQVKLVEAGVLKYTGNVIRGINPITGQPAEVPEIQPIHTYATWKQLGFQVKRGEKAVAKFAIWKYTTGKKKGETEDEAQQAGHCFLKVSAWFTDEQVEPIQ